MARFQKICRPCFRLLTVDLLHVHGSWTHGIILQHPTALSKRGVERPGFKISIEAAEEESKGPLRTSNLTTTGRGLVSSLNLDLSVVSDKSFGY